MSIIKKLFILIYFSIWFYFLIIWQGIVPPDINKSDINSIAGSYWCRLKSGGNFGSRGNDTVNGTPYYRSFSYFYGIYSPTMCLENLNGKTVRIYFLSPKNTDKKLLLELIDVNSGKIYGNHSEKQLEIYKNEVSNRYVFFAFKLGIFFLVNLIVFGKFISNRLIKK